MTKHIALEKIRTDGGTQMRASIDNELLLEYRQHWLDKADFPPIELFYDGAEYWLADGFHRFYGAREAKLKTIPATIRNGSLREAILFAVGANTRNGLRRTNKDKRQSVLALLNDDEWVKWSDRKIAEAAGVGHQLVAECRNHLDESSTSSPSSKSKDEPKIGRDGKIYPAKSRPSEPTPAAIELPEAEELGVKWHPPSEPEQESAVDAPKGTPKKADPSPLKELIDATPDKLVIARWLFDSCTEQQKSLVSVAWSDWWKD